MFKIGEAKNVIKPESRKFNKNRGKIYKFCENRGEIYNFVGNRGNTQYA